MELFAANIDQRALAQSRFDKSLRRTAHIRIMTFEL